MTAIAEIVSNQPTLLDLDRVRIDPVWALRVPLNFASRKRLLPLCCIDGTVTVAHASPLDATTLKSLHGYLKQDVRLVAVDSGSLRRVLKRVYDTPTFDGKVVLSQADVQAAGNDAVTLCDELLRAAILRDASDIHLVPTANALTVQLRVCGALETYRELPLSVQPLILSRLKVLAGMDIAEKRAAQDGRITSRFASGRKSLDIRVATLPTRYGERMTLRLLTAGAAQYTLPSLGMNETGLQTFCDAATRPHGLILLTGPTGSGKSTTLYVAIEQVLRTRGGNVITIEDPIEYEIAGASQVEVDSADKVNFSKALRSVLRHDPDVVMIGEIRDPETASIAVKASLTGHLVFSTVHTNTSVGVVTRLLDMGIEPFLIAATLRLSVAQRLVRRLCSACRTPRPMTQREAESLRQPQLIGSTVFDPAGCVMCAGRGFTGRIALFEMLASNEEISKLITARASEDSIAHAAQAMHYSTLVDDGVQKILDGTTTVSDVLDAVATW